MKPSVSAHLGNIFEGSADLTVLPCGAKPTWTSSTERWIETYKLPNPKQLMEGNAMNLGDVTPPQPFPGAKSITKYFSYGAAVLNGQSSTEIVRLLGTNIGKITKENPSIRRVESVLFGTGNGKLTDRPAARALANGFRETASKDASLWIFFYGDETRRKNIEAGIGENFLKRAWEAVEFKFALGPVSINVKKMLGLEK